MNGVAMRSPQSQLAVAQSSVWSFFVEGLADSVSDEYRMFKRRFFA